MIAGGINGLNGNGENTIIFFKVHKCTIKANKQKLIDTENSIVLTRGKGVGGGKG